MPHRNAITICQANFITSADFLTINDGLILILIGLPSTIFFISGVFSILSYTN